MAGRYRQRGGLVIKYMIYRKYEVMGLLFLSLTAYIGYKLYSIGGIVINPLTNKKNLSCLNP